ncbi:4-hydroxy-tetrahydrodipicolinate synthase [Candidatus Bathyarchaeota archaeon]|nr:4-hydroxy-tetrahydrodipicolinate synthase [Candidatus Bathyarchaeota archaeon]
MTGKLALKGVFVPMITPFKQNEEIDEESLRAFTDFLVENGVHGVIPCGSTGEYVLMSADEHKKVVKIVVDQVNGKIPVVAGAGNPGTRNALDLAKYAKDVGADGILAVTPYYHNPTDEGLLEHYRTLAEKGDIPTILYNLPRVTGYDLNPALATRLAEIRNLVGIKDSTWNFAHTMDLIRYAADKITIVTGYSEYLLPALVIGAKGGIMTGANVVPRLHLDVYNAFQTGDMKGALRLHNKLLPLSRFLFVESNPLVPKKALDMIGVKAGFCRKPLQLVTKSTEDKLRNILTDLELL